MRWQYGVTSVHSRVADGTLRRTLASLAAGGFDSPCVFVDGCYMSPLAGIDPRCAVTVRYPAVGAFGNWVLSLWELYLRDPTADRYAIFQDDVVTCRNLRAYLGHCHHLDKGYWNLFTFRDNESLTQGPVGWRESCLRQGNTNLQTGRGALALVFDREAAMMLLSQPGLVTHAQNEKRRIDGAVVEAMNIASWREFVHVPSLVQHVGAESTLSGKVHTLAANSFPGEEFDAMTLLDPSDKAVSVPAAYDRIVEDVLNEGSA